MRIRSHSQELMDFPVSAGVLSARLRIVLLLVFATLLSVRCLDGAESLLPIELGSPVRIEVFPKSIQLTGVRQVSQLVVTAHYADGRVQDVTRVCKILATDPTVAKVAAGITFPVGDGATDLVVSVAGIEAKVAITVARQGLPDPVSFQYGALAGFSKQGCSAGACHGAPSGKGGFRLSLRAFDPQFDAATLVREDGLRRVNPVAPDQSLVLLKPLMKVPHGGGLQIRKTDPAYKVIRDWIGEGCHLDTGETTCVKLEVFPPSGRVLLFPAHTQQLAVLGHFSDGTVRDVTQLAIYSSSDEDVASISSAGLVNGSARGETALIVRYLDRIQTSFITFVRDVEGFEYSEPPIANYIDELAFEKLRQLQYQPAELSTDSEFIRRVYLDVIGLLPPPNEVELFLADESKDKRTRLIDNLLERPEYAKFWALKWGDLLKLTSNKVGPQVVHKYARWLESSIATNQPYDQFARALIASRGSTVSNPPANFYRTAADMNEAVENVSQVFLGARLQCAQCHNHPFESWTQDNYYGMAAFFHRVQRQPTGRDNELIIWTNRSGQVTQPRTRKVVEPWVPQLETLGELSELDRRETFVDWLTRADNAYFAKVEVNRIWAHIMGRGIVDPPDDFRASNPPSNAKLLEALALEFSRSGYDRKKMLRTMLNSRTYQASFRTSEYNRSDSKYFSHYQARLLGAEQMLDAICQLTDRPETFAGLPVGTKATQLPAPDIVQNDFLKTLGQPERQTVCACERSGDSNLTMAIQFFNGRLIAGKLKDKQNRFHRMIAADKSDEEITSHLYLAGLSRPPTPTEFEATLAHLRSKSDRGAAFEDICWAMMNTVEFLFQH
ncbi:MAG: hypothetical protein ACI9HK_000262 [Pirellulaceae bacterium]|jgi:hypothetical protein